MDNNVTYMSIKQTAQKTGIAESCIRKLVKDGGVPGVYVGVKYMVNVPLFVEQLNKTSQKGGVLV